MFGSTPKLVFTYRNYFCINDMLYQPKDSMFARTDFEVHPDGGFAKVKTVASDVPLLFGSYGESITKNVMEMRNALKSETVPNSVIEVFYRGAFRFETQVKIYLTSNKCIVIAHEYRYNTKYGEDEPPRLFLTRNVNLQCDKTFSLGKNVIDEDFFARITDSDKVNEEVNVHLQNIKQLVDAWNGESAFFEYLDNGVSTWLVNALLGNFTR